MIRKEIDKYEFRIVYTYQEEKYRYIASSKCRNINENLADLSADF